MFVGLVSRCFLEYVVFEFFLFEVCNFFLDYFGCVKGDEFFFSWIIVVCGVCCGVVYDLGFGFG